MKNNIFTEEEDLLQTPTVGHTQGGTVYWEDLDTFIFFVGAAKIESPFEELISIVFSRMCVGLVQSYNEVECCSFFSP